MKKIDKKPPQKTNNLTRLEVGMRSASSKQNI